MVTRGTAGDHGCSTICEASSKGRVAAYLTSPWMPPFSPTGIVEAVVPPAVGLYSGLGTVTQKFVALAGRAGLQLAKIGRASCRERVEGGVVGVCGER